MQLDYLTCRGISCEDLFDGRLERFGIHEEVIEGSTLDNYRCLVDGQNHCVWVWGHDEVILISVFGDNNAEKIFAAIEECLNVHIKLSSESEYEIILWEGKYIMAAESTRKTDDVNLAEFYVETMKHVRGVPNDLDSDSFGAKMVDVAKDLITENPSLACLSSAAQLLKKTRRAYAESLNIDQKKPLWSPNDPMPEIEPWV